MAERLYRRGRRHCGDGRSCRAMDRYALFHPGPGTVAGQRGGAAQDEGAGSRGHTRVAGREVPGRGGDCRGRALPELRSRRGAAGPRGGCAGPAFPAVGGTPRYPLHAGNHPWRGAGRRIACRQVAPPAQISAAERLRQHIPELPGRDCLAAERARLRHRIQSLRDILPGRQPGLGGLVCEKGYTRPAGGQRHGGQLRGHSRRRCADTRLRRVAGAACVPLH